MPKYTTVGPVYAQAYPTPIYHPPPGLKPSVPVPPPAPIEETFSFSTAGLAALSTSIQDTVSLKPWSEVKAPGSLKPKKMPMGIPVATVATDEVQVCGVCGRVGEEMQQACCIEYPVRVRKSSLVLDDTGRVRRAVAKKVAHH